MTLPTGNKWFKKAAEKIASQDTRDANLGHQQLLQTLGRTIRDARRQRRMTQEELGELADMNPKYLGEVELGRSNPSICLLHRLAKALELDLTDLFLACQRPIEGDIALYKKVLEVLHTLNQPEMEKLKQLVKKLFE